MLRAKRRKKQFDEVHQYVEDLESITELRNRAEERGHLGEFDRYNVNIEVMQLVLEQLNGKLT